MDDKHSYELNKAHEIDIANGGQGLQNDEYGVLDAVKNKEKTPDQIERMMSQEEIFNVVKENGIYTNMLAPCLSANVFLDARIMTYFTTPMKPIDLEDKVIDVMQLVLMDISKEQNGVVFKSDGRIDVGESIKQAALNGMQTIPLLRDTMPDGMADALAQRYYDMNRTGMDAAWGITIGNESGSIDKEHLDKIISFGINNTRDAYELFNNHERYHDMFENMYSNSEREDLRKKKTEVETKLTELEARAKELKEEMENMPADSENYQELLNELVRINQEKAGYSKEIDKIGNLDEPKLEEVKAKGLLAEVRIMQLMGLKVSDYKHISKEIKELNKDSSISRLATRHEGVTKNVERKYLEELSSRDALNLQTYKNKLTTGDITEDERNVYLIESLKNYFTYASFSEKRTDDVLSSDIINVNINQAIDGIVANIPSVRGRNGEINWERVVDFVKGIPGYEDISLDNLKKTFLMEKADDIKLDLDTIIKSAEIDFEEHDELSQSQIIEQIKENDKELELIKYVNYVQRLQEKGIENAATRMFRYKLEMEDMTNILKRAEETYSDSEFYVEEMMDNYKRGYALSKYRSYSKLSDREKRALTKEEKGAYISAMIAAYDISRDESDISLEIQAATKDVFGTLLGDVFDEIGDIDDDKLFEKYKQTFKYGSKYALGKESEDMDAFWEFHEQISLNKVQKKIVDNFFKAVNDKKKDITQEVAITEPEVKKVVNERGEALDISAITDPQKPKPVEPSKITKKEAEDAVKRQGEQMRVDDPKVANVDNKTVAAPSVDKKKEEQGNTVRTEEVQVGETSLVPQKKPSLFSKAWNILKEKVSNLFGGNSDSNNTDTTANNNTSGTGGVTKDDKTQQVAQQNNNWVQQATISVEQAHKDLNESKSSKDLTEPEDPTL